MDIQIIGSLAGDIVAILGQVVLIGSIIAKYTKNPKDDTFFGKAHDFLERYVALNNMEWKDQISRKKK